MRFLVSHGGWIWKLALLVLTLASTALAARGRWARAPVIAALFAVGWYGVIYAAGQIVLPANAAPYDHFSKRLIASTAFPGARDEALERILHAPTTNDDAGLAIDVERMIARGVCPDQRYAERGKLEQAAAQPCAHSGYALQLGEVDRIAKPHAQPPRAVSARRWIELAVRFGISLDDVNLDAAPLGIAKLARHQVPDEIDIASPCPLRDALRAALAGDGGPLATLARSCRIAWDDVLLVEAVLPRIRTHRAELAMALRGLRDPYAADETLPAVLIDTYAHYRDLSRLAGDIVETARWQARVERFAALLTAQPIATR